VTQCGKESDKESEKSRWIFKPASNCEAIKAEVLF
jgi:hypothetical protein